MKIINTMYPWSQCWAAKSYLTVCEPMDSSTPGFPVLHDLLVFAQIHIHWVDDAIQLSHPLWPPNPFLLPSIFSSIFSRGFSSESALHIRRPKYSCYSISPSNEYSVLIFFRIDWFDLLAVEESLKSLFSTTILKHQFFGTQPSLCSKSLNCTWLLKHRVIFSVSVC